MPKKGKEIQTRIYLEDWQYAILKDYRSRGMTTLSKELLEECKKESSVSIDTIKTWINNQTHTNRKGSRGSSTNITTWHIFSEEYQKVNPFDGDMKKMGAHSAARGAAYRQAMKNKKKKAELVRKVEERKHKAPEEMSEDQKKRAIKKLHSDIEKKCKNLKLFGYETACLTFAIHEPPSVVGSPHVSDFLLYECNSALTKCHEHVFGNLDPKTLKTGSLVSNIRARFSYIYANALGRKTETVPLPYKHIGRGQSVVIVKGLPEGIPVKQPDRYTRGQLESIYRVLGEIEVEIHDRHDHSAQEEVVDDEVNLSQNIENGGSTNTELMLDKGSSAREILEQLANGGSCAVHQEVSHNDMMSFTAGDPHEIQEIEFVFSPEVENDGSGDEESLERRAVKKRRLMDKKKPSRKHKDVNIEQRRKDVSTINTEQPNKDGMRAVKKGQRKKAVSTVSTEQQKNYGMRDVKKGQRKKDDKTEQPKKDGMTVTTDLRKMRSGREHKTKAK